MNFKSNDRLVLRFRDRRRPDGGHRRIINGQRNARSFDSNSLCAPEAGVLYREMSFWMTG